MKRGGPDHPKTKALATVLGITRYQAVGLLESLWHFTAQYAKRGDIGKWSDVEIATALEWDRSTQELMDALLAVRFLDRCPVQRLLVHDWKEHSDQTVQRSEEVQKLGFASIQQPQPKRRKQKLANASQPGQLANASQPSLALPSQAKPEPIVCTPLVFDDEADPRNKIAWWLVWWNGLKANRLVASGVDVPPAEASLKAWSRILASEELRRGLNDPERIRQAVQDSDFCRGGWFTFAKLMGGKNRDGEYILTKLLNGGFSGGNHGGAIRNDSPARVREPGRYDGIDRRANKPTAADSEGAGNSTEARSDTPLFRSDG